MIDPYSETLERLGDVFRSFVSEKGAVSESEFTTIYALNIACRTVLDMHDPAGSHLIPEMVID